MFKCTNCKWRGIEAKSPLNHCPVCGDNTVALSEEQGLEQSKSVPEPVEKKLELDLNNDGKVDKKDAKIAGKVLAKHRHSKQK